MSKAFTRESDDLPEQRPITRNVQPTGKSYLTASGARRMREELQQLTASGAQDAESQSRMQQLQQTLAIAEVVQPPAPPWEQVLFGATVTVRNDAGVETTYRIVGVDEIDLDKDWVGATSPIARALLKARTGQRVSLKLPSGGQNLTITGIRYE